ncbi:EAL domain-containing protein [Lactobacillus sp. 3B(2020)]|uniref:EAL domain-containing protein n=1 Tax=Lactobacillus sp. 3B(2020) TaxID=2695882 RepID=UPI0021078451|nr:EAL domain-containing protein [Lactobacillus sp. 3B(2020)]
MNQQQLTVEIDAKDLLNTPRYQQRHLQRLLKTLDHHQIQVTIENIDSSKEMYQKLQRFLPGVDFLKFRIDAFKKSENHWIDITLAQWQRQAQAKNVKIVVGKIETPIQVELANQLAIPLRQGYAYGQPVTLKPEK